MVYNFILASNFDVTTNLCRNKKNISYHSRQPKPVSLILSHLRPLPFPVPAPMIPETDFCRHVSDEFKLISQINLLCLVVMKIKGDFQKLRRSFCFPDIRN